MSLLDEFLTREQLASELHVTPRTLARWQSQPNGIPTTRIGGRVLFNIDSVRGWLKSREVRPNQRRVPA